MKLDFGYHFIHHGRLRLSHLFCRPRKQRKNKSYTQHAKPSTTHLLGLLPRNDSAIYDHRLSAIGRVLKILDLRHFVAYRSFLKISVHCSNSVKDIKYGFGLSRSNLLVVFQIAAELAAVTCSYAMITRAISRFILALSALGTLIIEIPKLFRSHKAEGAVCPCSPILPPQVFRA